MKRVFLIHGWEASPHAAFFPWLLEEFSKIGYEVYAPQIPNTDDPVIAEWVTALGNVVGTPGPHDYFVGHSIGCQTIMRYLEQENRTVGGAVFVAGWFYLDNLDDPVDIALARPWLETPINTQLLKALIPKSTLIISDNDPFGCVEENRRRFAEFVTKEIVLHDAGHITDERGYDSLPQAIEEIGSMQES